MKFRSALAAILSILLLAGWPAYAQQAQKGREAPSKTVGEKIREALPEAQMVFTKEERTLVTNWFRDNRRGLPPGLAKRERLPPGLEKQLRERGHLPPGLQKKIQPLPPALERQMRILPTGFRRVVVAGNVLLMNEKTAEIYDIVRNVIP
jgi:hypothetical protein